jgi:DNA-directed RNA polymerase specialized sigma24 family protein
MERTRVMRAQGFTERQIAQALGVPVTTVRARLRRARERGMATQKGAR